MKKLVCLVLIGIVAGSLLTGCGNKNKSSESEQSRTTFEDEADEKEPEKNVTDEKKDEIDYSEIFSYQINEDGKTINLSAYKQKGENEVLEIPEEIDGYVVTGLSYPNGMGTFAQDNKLKEVIIPNTVIGIGESCFLGCENLQKIEMKEGLKEIGRSAFTGCKSLIKLDFPKTVESIKDHAVECCDSLEEVRLPENLKDLSQYNFRSCYDQLKVYLTAGSPAEEMVKNIYENEEKASGSYVAQ